jgi:hypothetical protein
MVQQTSIEWLIHELNTRQKPLYNNQIDELFEQAKVIYNNEIMKAWDDGYNEGLYDGMYRNV